MQNELGNITISQEVFLTLASKAAVKVAGVTKFGKSLLESVTSFVTRKNHQGVTAEVGSVEVAFDIKLVIDYGYKIPEVAIAVQKMVISEVESITGYKVVDVNVTFVDVHFPPAFDGTDVPSEPKLR